jgi:hypothetical protein
VDDSSTAITRYAALIHFYFHVDPDTLSDEEFAKYWGRLVYVLRLKNELE